MADTSAAPLTITVPRRIWVFAFAAVAAVVALSWVLAAVVPSNLTGGFAVILTGVATLTLASLTAVLLWSNWQMVKATTAMASATRAEADATLKEADASKQATAAIQAQVEADSRPVVVVIRRGGSEVLADTVTIANLGRGPALNCLYFSIEDGKPGWDQTGVINIGSGGERTTACSDSHLPMTPAMFGDAPGPLREVVLCEDVAGRAYRFRVPAPVPDIWQPGGAEREPDWAHIYLSEVRRKTPETPEAEASTLVAPS